jgi:hypothetical protein
VETTHDSSLRIARDISKTTNLEIVLVTTVVGGLQDRDLPAPVASGCDVCRRKRRPNYGPLCTEMQ